MHWLKSRTSKNLEEQPRIVSSFCCRFNDAQKQSCHEILKKLVYDFAAQSAPYRSLLIQKFRRRGAFNQQDYMKSLSSKQIWEIFIVDLAYLLRNDFKGFWVIDGVDEMPTTERATFLDLLTDCQNFDIGISVFIASRKDVDILRSLTRLGALSIVTSEGANAEDIMVYLNARLDQWGCHDSINIREKVMGALSIGAEGMFLWVKLMVDVLEDTYFTNEIDEVLRTVPGDLEAIYCNILDRMVAKSTSNQLEMLKQLFAWILFAARPLTVEELAVALSRGTQQMTARAILKAAEDLCGPLLRLDPPSEKSDSKFGILSFMHASLATFLQNVSITSSFHIDKAQENQRLLMVCIDVMNAAFNTSWFFPFKDSPFFKYSTYVHVGWIVTRWIDGHPEPSPRVLRAEDSDTATYWQLLREDHPFLQYSMEHWCHHLSSLNLSNLQETCWEMILDKFLCVRSSRAWLFTSNVYRYWEAKPFDLILDFCSAGRQWDELRVDLLEAWATTCKSSIGWPLQEFYMGIEPFGDLE